MYAILQHGGHQYRVSSGDRLLVDRLPAEVGSTVSLEPVMLVGDGDTTTVEPASLRGAHVTAVVVAHRLGHKIRVFSYKPKKRHRRTLGYRSKLTELRVDQVVAGEGAAPPKRRASTAKSAAAPAAGASSSPRAPRGAAASRRKRDDGA